MTECDVVVAATEEVGVQLDLVIISCAVIPSWEEEWKEMRR